MGGEHCTVLHRVADGRAEFHHHNFRSAGKRHDADAHAAHMLVVVRHSNSGPAGIRSAALGWDFVAAGSQFRDKLLCAASRCEWPGDGTQRWLAAPLATPVLVFWASGGLHRHSAWNGRDLAGDIDLLSQTYFRI